MWISLPHDRYYDEGYNITQCFRVTHRCKLRTYTSDTTYNEKEYLCDVDSLEYYDIRSLQNIGADITINESICSAYKATDSTQIGTAIALNGVVKGYYIIQLGDEEKAIIAGKVSRKIDKYLWRRNMTWIDGTACVVVLSNQRVIMHNAASEAEIENENWMLDLGAYANGQTPCLRQVVLNHDSPVGFNVKPHTFGEIHPDRLSFSLPVQQAFTKDGDTSVQWYGWKIAINDAERYNALDRFTENMYCVSEADIEEVGGWHTEAELAELGYTLYVEPPPTVTILGDIGYKTAATVAVGGSGHLYFNHTGNVEDRIPFDNSSESICYYKYLASPGHESTVARPEGLTFSKWSNQLTIVNNGLQSFQFYGVYAYKVGSTEVETVQAWSTNGSDQTAWFIKWRDKYCWMDGTNTDWLTEEQWFNAGWSFTEVLLLYTNTLGYLKNDASVKKTGVGTILYKENSTTYITDESETPWEILKVAHTNAWYNDTFDLEIVYATTTSVSHQLRVKLASTASVAYVPVSAVLIRKKPTSSTI